MQAYMSTRLAIMLAAAGFIIVVTAGIAAYLGVRLLTDGQSRQEEVAARGALVMPFDLDKTTHVFRKMDDGGVQTVTANDPADTEQVALIRSHLQGEMDRFSDGDFGDPASIHGGEMPGLRELEDRAAELRLEYRELPDGASIVYTSEAGDVIAALHVWFDAQLADHGNHAHG